MMPNDHDWLTENAVDLLVALLGQRAYERMDPMDPANARFLEYLAREARLRLTAAERRELNREAVLFAERIRRRVASEREAQRHRVRCVNEAPPMYPATDDGDQLDAAGDDPFAPASHAADMARTRHDAPWWDLAIAAGSGRELSDCACRKHISTKATRPVQAVNRCLQ